MTPGGSERNRCCTLCRRRSLAASQRCCRDTVEAGASHPCTLAAKAAKAARPARKSRYLRLSLAICYGLARAVSLDIYLPNVKKCWQAIMHRRFATRSHAAMSSIEKIIASDSPTKKIDLVVVPVRRLPMMFPLLRGQSRRLPQPEVGILGLLRVLSHKTEGQLLGLGPPFRCRARPARP